MKYELFFDIVPFTRFGIFKRKMLFCLGQNCFGGNDYVSGIIRGVWFWRIQIGITIKGGEVK